MLAGTPGWVRALRDRLLAEEGVTEEDGVYSQGRSLTSGRSYFGSLGWEESKRQGGPEQESQTDF